MMLVDRETSIGPDHVKISLLNGRTDKAPPLVISPRFDPSHAFLCDFLVSNQSWLNDQITEYGAVLFRGFEIKSPAEFESAIKSYQPRLNNTYRGTSPRVLIPDTNYVFSAAEVPVNYPIAQHLEMSFLPAPPRQLFFHCVKASASPGGETALCDFRQVYKDIPSHIRDKMLKAKIRYTRTNRKVGARFTYDVSDMVGWPQLFGTSSKTQVERMCRDEGMIVQWTGPNQDVFLSVLESEAFQRHPITNEPVWFNHTQVFHWTTFPVELYYAFLRTLEVRLLIHCILISIFSIVMYGILGRRMSLDSRYGDDSNITAWEMFQIRRAIHKNMVFNRWQAGDILCIDNFSTSHGRQPTFDKGRKVVVAWSDPLVKANNLTWSDPMSELCENPQEHTLTKDTAKNLLEAMRAPLQSSGYNPQEWSLTSEGAKSLSDAFVVLGLKKDMAKRFSPQSSNLMDPSSDFWKSVRNDA